MWPPPSFPAPSLLLPLRVLRLPLEFLTPPPPFPVRPSFPFPLPPSLLPPCCYCFYLPHSSTEGFATEWRRSICRETADPRRSWFVEANTAQYVPPALSLLPFLFVSLLTIIIQAVGSPQGPTPCRCGPGTGSCARGGIRLENWAEQSA